MPRIGAAGRAHGGATCPAAQLVALLCAALLVIAAALPVPARASAQHGTWAISDDAAALSGAAAASRPDRCHGAPDCLPLATLHQPPRGANRGWRPVRRPDPSGIAIARTASGVDPPVPRA